jgi:hypothetical protein
VVVTKEYVVDCGVIDWAFEKTCVVRGRVALKSGEMWRNVGFFSCH